MYAYINAGTGCSYSSEFLSLRSLKMGSRSSDTEEENRSRRKKKHRRRSSSSSSSDSRTYSRKKSGRKSRSRSRSRDVQSRSHSYEKRCMCSSCLTATIVYRLALPHPILWDKARSVGIPCVVSSSLEFYFSLFRIFKDLATVPLLFKNQAVKMSNTKS